MKRTVEEVGKRARRTRGKGRVIKRRGGGYDGREDDDVAVEDKKVS